VSPAQRRQQADGQVGIDQAKAVATARPDHQPMPAQPGMLMEAAGGAVDDRAARRCPMAAPADASFWSRPAPTQHIHPLRMPRSGTTPIVDGYSAGQGRPKRQEVPQAAPGSGDYFMLGTILLIILILLLIGALPSWGYSRSWGYGPTGILGVILIVIIVLMLMGRI
jgi:hypothetical protein